MMVGPVSDFIVEVCALLVTGFIGWISLSVFKATNKIVSLDTKVGAMSDDIKALRNNEIQVAILTTNVADLARRVNVLENPHESAS
jgi:hypothetical protein